MSTSLLPLAHALALAEAGPFLDVARPVSVLVHAGRGLGQGWRSPTVQVGESGAVVVIT